MIGTRHRKNFLVLILSATLATTVASRTTNADPFLREGLKRLAASVKEQLKKNGYNEVTVGDFIARNVKASSGPGLSLQIAQQLKALDVSVKEKAPVLLSGKFSITEQKEFADSRFPSLVLKIRAELVLKDADEELAFITIPVFGDAVDQTAGNTVELPIDKDAAERQRRRRDAIRNPSAFVAGNETRASANSHFGIEIRVVKQRKKLPNGAAVVTSTEARTPDAKVLAAEGRSFARLDKRDEYIVRLYNRAPFEAAVTLTIDGLNMFTFSKESNFVSQILIPPGKFVEIPGWYITSTDTDAFLITGFPDSAVANLGVTSQVGAITAQFHAAWDPKDKPPKDEVNPKSANTATARGRQIEQKYEKVKRVVGRSRAVVTVRYNR